jgi:hypothetical protein
VLAPVKFRTWDFTLFGNACIDRGRHGINRASTKQPFSLLVELVAGLNSPGLECLVVTR